MNSILSTSDFTHHALIEMTSRCNLRCVYCAVSQPEYHGRDFDLRFLENLLDSLQRRKIGFLTVNGHGETTLVKDWHLLCNEWLKKGLRLAIITNLAKRLSDEEVLTLSQFVTITVSIDTADPDLLRKIRKGAELKVILENMARIRECSAGKSAKPKFLWHAVLTDKTVFGIVDLVKLGLREGVRAFRFLSLTKYPDVSSEMQVNHVSSLPHEELRTARQRIDEAIGTARSSGGTVYCQTGILETIDEKLKNEGMPEQPAKRLDPRRDFTQWKAGYTRDCFRPWFFAAFDAAGKVRPCCYQTAVGQLDSNSSLQDILNNQAMISLRRRLLAGRLDQHCGSCPGHPWIPTRGFRVKIWFYWLAFQLICRFPPVRYLALKLAVRYWYF